MNSGSYDHYSAQLESFWAKDILSRGFVAVPVILLEYREFLKINTTELTVLITLLSFRHGNRPVYPSVKKISERSGVEPRVVYRATASLERKGLLVKDPQPGRTTNYDLGGLVEELKYIDEHVR